MKPSTASAKHSSESECEALQRKWEPILDELRPGMEDAFVYYLEHGFHRDTDADRQTKEKYTRAVTEYAREILVLETKYGRIAKKLAA